MIIDAGYATLCPDEEILREIMAYDIMNPIARHLPGPIYKSQSHSLMWRNTSIAVMWYTFQAFI